MELANEVVDYRVVVNELSHRSGTREVVQSEVEGLNTEMRQATISQGLGED